MSLLIATPMYGGQCHVAHFRSCLKLKDALWEGEMPHDWLLLDRESLITRGRDTLAHGFLETSYERMLFIDGDIEFSPEDVAKLWNLDEDVCCGAYRMKKPDAPLAVWKGGQLRDISEETEPLSVDYAGTGFMMIKRGVFDVMKTEEWGYEDGVDMTTRYGFFQDPIVDRVKLSEDYFFCREWRKHGKIVCDPSIRLKHWGWHGY